jgi:hypothetical protein
MKVKELIKLLKEHDENIEVCIDVYTGCLTPALKIKVVQLIKKGSYNDEGGELFNDADIAVEDMLILRTKEM